MEDYLKIRRKLLEEMRDKKIFNLIPNSNKNKLPSTPNSQNSCIPTSDNVNFTPSYAPHDVNLAGLTKVVIDNGRIANVNLDNKTS